MLGSLMSVVAAVSTAAMPVTVYDLTYALKFDAKDARQVAAAWDHAHVVATLQGIVNRSGPRLYVRFVEAHGRNIDDYWLATLRRPGGWLAGSTIRSVRGLPSLVAAFRSDIKGAVVYDPAVPATSNLASTIAGIEDLVAIRYDPDPQSVYAELVTRGPKLPVVRRLMRPDGSPLFTGRGKIPETEVPSTGSAKCDAYMWLKARYLDAGKVGPGYAGYYLDAYWQKHPAASVPNQHTLTNHDFFVAKRAFFFDLNVWGDEAPVDDPGQPLGADARTLTALLRSAYEHGARERLLHIGGFTPWAFKYTNAGSAGGKHEGVASEWEFCRVASAYNAFIDADANNMGAIANASFYMHFPLRARYPQRWLTPSELTQRGYLAADGRVQFDGREFMIFYVGDFDSAAWMYQFMPAAWDHPARGRVPLMWCVSPVLERRVPMILDYMRQTASPNDYFATSDNGAGYLNPGMLQEPRISGLPSGLEAWARHCLPIYRRWDITITGFIIDGVAPGLDERGLDCYARFSPNGIVAQKIPPSLLHGDMPVLRADYDLTNDPDSSAQRIVARVAKRRVPFHWFRGILKTPDWYEAVYAKVRAANPQIELLDAPTFFELYRAYLKTNPEAAAGKLPLEK